MKKKIIILSTILILLVGVIIFYLLSPRLSSKEQEVLKMYNEKSQTIMKNQKLNLEEYSKTLDIFLSSNDYKSEYLKEYQEITYVETDNFINKVNVLLEKNYQTEEINNIFAYLSDENITKLLEMTYINLDKFYKITNLDVMKITDYLAYQEKENISLNDAVTRVNLHLNEPFYQTITEIENPNDITVLVNKSFCLPSTYVPSDLTPVNNTNFKMRKESASHLEELIASASLDGRMLIPYSTYRSYDYQKELYNYYKGRDPVDVVDTYSARPGHSEHQTGLACDIRSAGYSSTLSDSDYAWMLDNSYKFGFIVRYPKGKSFVTGYKEEPWHIRYIGKEHATKVHELDITYDEYYDLYIKK